MRWNRNNIRNLLTMWYSVYKLFWKGILHGIFTLVYFACRASWNIISHRAGLFHTSFFSVFLLFFQSKYKRNVFEFLFPVYRAFNLIHWYPWLHFEILFKFCCWPSSSAKFIYANLSETVSVVYNWRNTFRNEKGIIIYMFEKLKWIVQILCIANRFSLNILLNRDLIITKLLRTSVTPV